MNQWIFYKGLNQDKHLFGQPFLEEELITNEIFCKVRILFQVCNSNLKLIG